MAGRYRRQGTQVSRRGRRRLPISLLSPPSRPSRVPDCPTFPLWLPRHRPSILPRPGAQIRVPEGATEAAAVGAGEPTNLASPPSQTRPLSRPAALNKTSPTRLRSPNPLPRSPPRTTPPSAGSVQSPSSTGLYPSAITGRAMSALSASARSTKRRNARSARCVRRCPRRALARPNCVICPPTPGTPTFGDFHDIA